jgi:hypothetical protein
MTRSIRLAQWRGHLRLARLVSTLLCRHFATALTMRLDVIPGPLPYGCGSDWRRCREGKRSNSRDHGTRRIAMTRSIRLAQWRGHLRLPRLVSTLLCRRFATAPTMRLDVIPEALPLRPNEAILAITVQGESR